MCCPGRASLTLCLRGLRALARAVRVPRCKSRCFNAKLQQAPPKTARGGGLVVFLYRRRGDGAASTFTAWDRARLPQAETWNGANTLGGLATPVPRFGSTGCAPESAHCHFRRSTSFTLLPETHLPTGRSPESWQFNMVSEPGCSGWVFPWVAIFWAQVIVILHCGPAPVLTQ